MKNLTFVALFAFIIVGCSDVYEELSTPPDIKQELLPLVRTRSGGVNENNPYSLSTVQKAIDEIVKETGSQPITLEPTHYYVKFTIQDSIQFDLLKDSLMLELFNHPLDRELTEEEYELYDSQESNEYYTLVPTSFVFPPEISKQILDYGFMQSGDNLTRSVSNQLPNELYDDVIDRAYENCGYEIAPKTRAKAYEPEANISFLCDFTNEEIPLEGVKIRTNTTFNSGSAYTDANGRAIISRGWGGKFRNKVKYKIIWETDRWNIRFNRVGQSKVEGPYSKDAWDRVIKPDQGRTYKEAAIHRAMHTYFYKETPSTAGITKCSIKKVNVGFLYEKYNDNKSARFTPLNRGLGGNSILIYGKNVTGNYRTGDIITSSTFHELGHATHWQRTVDDERLINIDRYTNYHFANGTMCESFAEAVGYAYMRDIIGEAYNYPYSGGDYTGIGESLMNQGFTLKQIESTVAGETSWYDGWKPAVISTNIAERQAVGYMFDFADQTFKVNMHNIISGPDVILFNIENKYSIPNRIVTNLFNQTLTTNVTWSVSGSDHTINSSNRDDTLRVKFSQPGQKTITAAIQFPNRTLTYTKTINVVSGAEIKAPMYSGSLVCGNPMKFEIINPTDDKVNHWNVISNDGSVRLLSQSSTEATFVFHKKGTYTIQAMKTTGSGRVTPNRILADITITINTGAEIEKFIGYFKVRDENNVWLTTNDYGQTANIDGLRYKVGYTINTTSSGRTGSSTASRWSLDPRSFYAFSSYPSSIPNSGLYELYTSVSGSSDKVYIYDGQTRSGYTNNGLKLWVFKNQVEGTVPLYFVSIGTNSKRYFLTTEIPNESGVQSRRVGYVYPDNSSYYTSSGRTGSGGDSDSGRRSGESSGESGRTTGGGSSSSGSSGSSGGDNDSGYTNSGRTSGGTGASSSGRTSGGSSSSGRSGRTS